MSKGTYIKPDNTDCMLLESTKQTMSYFKIMLTVDILVDLCRQTLANMHHTNKSDRVTDFHRRERNAALPQYCIPPLQRAKKVPHLKASCNYTTCTCINCIVVREKKKTQTVFLCRFINTSALKARSNGHNILTTFVVSRCLTT